LSFGLSHLNTVERRKIRSGSSAAEAWPAGQSSIASSRKVRDFRQMSSGLPASHVMITPQAMVSADVGLGKPSRKAIWWQISAAV
jgi:hypothetical protein